MMTTLFIVLSILSITCGQPPSNDPIVNGLDASAFSSSSEYVGVSGACADENARYFEPGPTDGESYSWCPDQYMLTQRPFPWLQIDLGQCYTITDVGTKGRNGANEWTKEYILTYSTDDANNLFFYNNITGNTDRNSEVFGVDSTMNHPSFIARYVRFTPIDWENYGSMRVELYGFENPSCTEPTNEPTTIPTGHPSKIPTNNPSKTPTQSTTSPTSRPTADSPDTDDSDDESDADDSSSDEVTKALLDENKQLGDGDNNDNNELKGNDDGTTTSVISLNFSNETLMNMFAMFGVLMIVNILFCCICNNKNKGAAQRVEQSYTVDTVDNV